MGRKTKNSPTTSSRRSAGLFGPPDSQTVNRVALYRRASTDEDNQPYSLDVQLTKGSAWVESQDNMVIVADYSEYASGKNIEGRPQFIRLLEDAAAGKFDTVVVYKLDRFSRRLSDTLAAVDFLDGHDIPVASVTEPIATNTPIGKLLLQILGSFAEFERELIAERVTRGIEAKVATGKPIGPIAYGLRKQADGIIEADPETIGVVMRIFNEYVHDLLGTKTIAEGLQKDKMPTPGAMPWAVPAVSRILRNRTYVGKLPYRGEWVDGAHAPVIAPELFEAAQVRADERSTQNGARRALSEYLLAGLVSCGHCDGAYVGFKGTGKSGTQFRYYGCAASRRYGAKTCSAPHLPADDLEKAVADALLDTYADSGLFTQSIESYVAGQTASVEPLTAELTAARTQLADRENAKARYKRDYEAGKLPPELYAENVAGVNTELEDVARRVLELEVALTNVELQDTPTDDDRADLYAALLEGIHDGPVPARKALYSALVESLVVHDCDDVRPTFRLGGPGLLVPAPQTEAEQVGQDSTLGTLLTLERVPDPENADARSPGDLASRPEVFAHRRTQRRIGDSNP